MFNPNLPRRLKVNVAFLNGVGFRAAQGSQFVVPVVAGLAEFIVGGVANGAHREMNAAKRRAVGVDGVPHPIGVVGHFAFAPSGGDDHHALHGCQASGVKTVHVNDVGLKAVIGGQLSGFFSQTGGVSSLRTEEDVDGTVASKHGVQGVGDASRRSNSDRRCGCFSLNGSGLNHRFFSPVGHQFVLDDFNGTGFGGFDDDVAKFRTQCPNQRGAPDVSVEITIGTNSRQNERGIIGDLEDLRTDVLTGIAGDTIFVNPNFCDGCHGMTSCSRSVGNLCQP